MRDLVLIYIYDSSNDYIQLKYKILKIFLIFQVIIVGRFIFKEKYVFRSLYNTEDENIVFEMSIQQM